ncbi:MAG: hypothetical protein JSR20_15510 [Nitrospira sp.]|nr:hypothetical protein [Nitrospira sp.]MBS1813235.1 hypothetical protein [Acidobacteriota bacterium]
MKLLSVSLARSIWLFPINDLNPRGRSLYFAIFAFLAQKYSFQKFPKTADDSDLQKGIKFEHGEFRGGTNNAVTVNATIYSDGIVVDMRSSTADADDFLVEALAAVSQEFYLPPITSFPVKKTYLSEVFVQTEHPLSLLNEKLGNFAHLLSTKIEGFGETHWETAGITFSIDQGIQPKPTPFRFERAGNVSFSDNRYYSVAPLKTEAHLELLNELELILLGNPYSD